MSAARVALVANAVFVALLCTLHGLKADLDLSWHFLSEYAIGRWGWLMQGAFLALALANLGTFAAIRPWLRTTVGKIGSTLFLAGTAGTVLAGLCITDPINIPPEAQTLSGMLHNIGGGLGLLGFTGTLIFSARLLRNRAWRGARLAAGIASTLVVLGFLFSFVSIATLSARYNGVFSPDSPIGWPNRVGILAGCAWLASVAWQSRKIGIPATSHPTASVG